MTYKHTAGYQRGESPSNVGRPTNTHTRTHTHADLIYNCLVFENSPELRRRPLAPKGAPLFNDAEFVIA